MNGKPLDAGTISFVPAQGSTGPSATAKIERGSYSIAAAAGLTPGDYVATITPGTVASAKPQGPPTAQPVIPERQEKPVTVKAGQANSFDFKFP